MPSKKREDITWDEVRKHTEPKDSWLVISGNVYDVSEWRRKHPGGPTLLRHYAGQDATDAFNAFHVDRELTDKYMASLLVGSLQDVEDDPKNIEMMADFEELRHKAIEKDLFRPSVVFFSLNLCCVLVAELIAFGLLRYVGTSWVTWWFSVLFLTISQIQASFCVHDYGHTSVFKTSKLNHLMQYFISNLMQGLTASAWNHLHFQHHAKTNVIEKDPDVKIDYLYVLGETNAKKIAADRKRYMPYSWQHIYFFLATAVFFPLTFPIYGFMMAVKQRHWDELFLMFVFYVKFHLTFSPLLGIPGMILYLCTMRMFQGYWFMAISQASHVPMSIEYEEELPWLQMHLNGTCNVERTAFNDWFSGHLDFQIEHHLFPTMPRHNLYKIAPDVRELCNKYDIPYIVKPMSTALADIIRSLKDYGELWAFYRKEFKSH